MNPLPLLLALVAGDAPVVVDACKLFDQATLDKVALDVRQIKKSFHRPGRDHGIDLFVETTRERPPISEAQKKQWLWFRKHRQRHETLDEFAMKRAVALYDERRETERFGGIYVVIIESEGGAPDREVGVAAYPAEWGADDETSWVKRDALRAILLSPEAKGDNNRGLSELVVRFRSQQESIIRPDVSSLSTRAALLLAATMVGVWLLVRFVHWREMQHAGPLARIAIYQPAMMGTLFGLPAAFWVNDELFRSLPPDVPPPTAGKPDSLSLPPMPSLPPPDAVTQAAPQQFTLPDPGPGGSPPTT